MVQKIIENKGIDTSKPYLAAQNVLPGKIMSELVENSRVIGGIEPESTAKVAHFYKTFVNGEILETQAKTAEMQN